MRLLDTYIINILKNYSDINHPLGCEKIAHLIKEKYDESCDRKTVLKTIQEMQKLDEETALSVYGALIYSCGSKGFTLEDASLKELDVSTVVKSILSDESLTASSKKDLIEKLCDTLPKVKKERLLKSYNSFFEKVSNQKEEYDYYKILRNIDDLIDYKGLGEFHIKLKGKAVNIIALPLSKEFDTNDPLSSKIKLYYNTGDWFKELTLSVKSITKINTQISIDKYGKDGRYYYQKYIRSVSVSDSSFGTGVLGFVTTDSLNEMNRNVFTITFDETGLPYFMHSERSESFDRDNAISFISFASKQVDINIDTLDLNNIKGVQTFKDIYQKVSTEKKYSLSPLQESMLILITRFFEDIKRDGIKEEIPSLPLLLDLLNEVLGNSIFIDMWKLYFSLKCVC